MNDEKKIEDVLSEVPILDMQDENFVNNLQFELWSQSSSFDYRNDRERPYNGQSWTDEGERGKMKVEGLTMRDIKDCLIKAMLISTPNVEYFNNFSKCWEVDGNTNKLIPTQFLLDRQDEYLCAKVELNTWSPQDIYQINFDMVDPMAICQNLTCEIEKMMGIFPNIEKTDL